MLNLKNQATLSGCLDIIAVKQPDGSLKASPFHARFGKNLRVMKTENKLVQLWINDVQTNILMKLGPAGEAYFVQATFEKIEDK